MKKLWRWWRMRRYIRRGRFVSDEPLSAAQMARALERSKRENWKDIAP